MALYDEPRDSELYARTIQAVLACNQRIRELEAEGAYIGMHYGFPKVTMNYFADTFPSISHFGTRGPVDYTEPFGLSNDTAVGRKIAYTDVPALGALIDHVRGSDELSGRLTHGIGLNDVDYVAICAARLALNLLDRCRHTSGQDVTEENVRGPYLALEAAYFAEDLPVEIIIPLVLTKFDCDTADLGENVVLERLDADTHCARVPSELDYWGAHNVVLDAATHAIVLKSWSCKRTALEHYSQSWFWPTEAIDTVMAALRIVSSVETGYAQLLMRPLGWSTGWKAHLPPLMRGPAVRRYPPHFENYYWLNKDIQTYDGALLPAVDSVHDLLKSATNPIPLAARRLNAAALREKDEDALIDACIGLEALFGDRAGEITYKLSLRVAAVAGRSPLARLDMLPSEIFRIVKKIYEYRSRLVHGDKNAEAKRLVELPDGNKEAAPKLAISLLRHSLLSVLERPAFTDATHVDVELVLTALDRDANARKDDE